MPSDLRIIGHRGDSAHAPENTLASFKLALDKGAEGIEFDVRLTRDGVPVVIHDETLQRTGKKKLRIDELTLEQLRDVEVGSWFTKGEFSGESLPTLQDTFDLFRNNDSLLYLEMKSSAAERQQLAQACCDAIQKNNLTERVIIESFDLPALECVKDVDPEQTTAALFEPSIATLPLLASRRITDAAGAVGASEIALHHRLATRRNVSAALDQGFQVVVWTVDDPVWIKRARELGVTALITNDPGLMLNSL